MTVSGDSVHLASTTPEETMRQIVELACRAPSVHNSQPWQWRIEGARLELHADRRRQLPLSDPVGRNLMISCGSALHHARVAAAGLGHHVEARLLPDDQDPDLLAVLELTRGAKITTDEVELLEALQERRTDRRRFTSWPVPEDRLASLARDAHQGSARVVPLTEEAARDVVERLSDEALDAQKSDYGLVAEQRAWIERGRTDGIPRTALPPQVHGGERRDRFDREQQPDETRKVVDSSDAVMAICTGRDDATAWLDTGETLSALWLQAELAGFSLVPLSQICETESTRRALHREVFLEMAQPQLIVRIGWQEISRAPLPLTPRRALTDVLLR